ncbi:MAG: hypothetical protein A2Z20_05225 [Bdellovibrionales bacterium RBG_16_40_8]|nr:MAG: hypothetical protein A2Z20_05225 [Bdellovibrionales bacterium RBG_16_40_8]
MTIPVTTTALKVGFTLFALLNPLVLRAAPTSLTLKQAIEYAIQHSHTLNSASHEVFIADFEKENAKSRFLPSLDLTAKHGIEDSSPSTRVTPWASELSLGLTETLYDNGNNITQYQISKLKKAQTEISYRKEKDLLCRDVGLEFLQYSLTTKLLKIQKDQYGLIKKQYESISGQYHQGMKTRKDFLRFKTQVSRSDIDLVTARNVVEKSKRELKRLLAVPIESTDELDFVPDEEKFDAGKLPKNAPSLEQHYDFRIAILKKEVNELEASLVRKKYWPEVSLTTGINYGSSNYIDTGSSVEDNDQVGWNALITLKYNLLDWGIRRRDSEIAAQRKAIQGNELDNNLLSVRSEVERLMLDLKQLSENFKLSDELLALEQNNLKLLEQEYRNGKVQYLDLITGLKDLADAKIKYFTAFYDLKRALLTYWYHEGKLYESIATK